MSIRSFITTAAVAATLAATAATPTLAASRAHHHNGISRQYESLVQRPVVAPAPVYQERNYNAWGHTFSF